MRRNEKHEATVTAGFAEAATASATFVSKAFRWNLSPCRRHEVEVAWLPITLVLDSHSPRCPPGRVAQRAFAEISD